MRPILIVCVGLVGCNGPNQGTDGPTDETDSGEPVVVRIATWNIEGLGSSNSAERQAELDVLRRINADIVGINEVGSDELGRLTELGQALGYDTIFMPSSNPFGGLRNAMLTRLPGAQISAVTSAAVSGDREANDTTRLPIRLTVELAGADDPLTVVVNHWKSGFNIDDRFRRTLDGIRTAQAADQDGVVVVMGDVNAELEDMPESPRIWTSLPDDLPGSFRLGDDQLTRLREDGIANNAFAPSLALGLTAVEARQLDGRPDTRPVSGRRIDWVLASDGVSVASEIYDSTDEGNGGLEKAGEAAERSASQQASDHLPIFIDITLP